MFWIFFIIIWFILGLWGHSIIYNSYYDIMKISWEDNRRTYMLLRIFLGPINLIWSIVESYYFKKYWHGVWQLNSSKDITKQIRGKGYYPRNK